MTSDRQHEDRTAATEGVSELCRWAATLQPDALPEEVLRRAALVLADDLAAVIAARDEPELRRVHDQMIDAGYRAEATVFRGGRSRTDRYSAAVANGAAANWCELDEGYRLAPCHGGLCVLPALWAEAEAERHTVAELLRALAIGYEVVARFARSFPFADLTLHPHATLPTIGAAAGIAAIRRQPPETFLAAVSGAATMVAPGPFNHAVEGVLVRNMWAGVGAWIGIRLVDWASFGIGGGAASPHDAFVGGFGTGVLPDELTSELGCSWAITEGYHKIFACCQYAHSAIEAAEELLTCRTDVVPAKDIERIIVETHRRGLSLDNPEPATSLAARFSLPHIMAAHMHFGHAGAEAFTASTLNDPAIASLRARVEIKPYEPERPWPQDRPARVTWVLRTGEQAEAECRSARGGPDRPFTQSEILEKVRGLTAIVYPQLPDKIRGLTELDACLLQMPWDQFVTEITSGTIQ